MRSQSRRQVARLSSEGATPALSLQNPTGAIRRSATRKTEAAPRRPPGQDLADSNPQLSSTGTSYWLRDGRKLLRYRSRSRKDFKRVERVTGGRAMRAPE